MRQPTYLWCIKGDNCSMNTFWLVFEYGINLIQGIMFTYFLCGSLKYKAFVKARFILGALCSVAIAGAITLCNYFSFYEGIAIFVYSALLYIFSLVFMEGTLLHKLFVSVVPVNAMSVGSIFSINFMAYILNKPIFDFMAQSGIYRLITVLMGNLILFMILFIIKRITTKTELKLMESEWFLLSINLILSVTAYMFMYYAIFSNNSISANFYNALCVVVIIIINISTYYMLAKFSNRYTTQLENNLLKQQIKNQTDTIIETKKQYDGVRKIKHDFSNIIGVIQTLNNEGKSEEIEQYISSRFDSFFNSSKILNTGNSFIDAIINTKLAEASTYGIDVRISTICELDDKYNIDICNLLGNLFDNAIRASSESKEKRINLDIRKEYDSITVTMKNSIDRSVLAENPALLSSKKNTKNHGYGTKIIKDIANKYNGFADFYEENDLFCCNIILYLDK